MTLLKMLILLWFIATTGPSAADKTYTGNQNTFWRMEHEYEQAVEKKHDLVLEERKCLQAQSALMRAKREARDSQGIARDALTALNLQMIKCYDEIRRDPKQKPILKSTMDALDKKIAAARLNLQTVDKAMEKKFRMQTFNMKNTNKNSNG